jgi:peptide/nickel transport system permease protein
VSFLAFLIIHLLPGDPVYTILGIEATPERVEALRRELGLDQPFLVQLGRWYADIFRGDFGESIIYGDSVANMIFSRLPVTFFLGLISLLLSVLLGVPAGIISAVRRGKAVDSIITVAANIGMAVPIFWLGILGIYFFGLTLGWLPVHGFVSPLDNFWLSIQHAIMPAICLAVLPLVSFTRQTRSSMLEVIRQDYIRTARSKGLKEGAIITGHALKNAIIPVVTLLGLQVRNLVGGSVLVETVFSLPGMGRLMVTAVFEMDFPVVQMCIIVIAVTVCLANLLVDISYGYIDPRIRTE